MRDYQAETLAHVTNLLMERSQEVGGLIGVIEMALLDLKYGRQKIGIARLQKAVDEYHAKQEATLIRLGLKTEPTTVSVASKPVPTMVREKDIPYELKHGE